jgi:hypothetical protein
LLTVYAMLISIKSEQGLLAYFKDFLQSIH